MMLFQDSSPEGPGPAMSQDYEEELFWKDFEFINWQTFIL